MLGTSLHEDTLLQEFGDSNGVQNRIHLQGLSAVPEPQQQSGQTGGTADIPSGSPSSYSYVMPSKTASSGQRFKLPYQVTPSRESGPSQAEKRLEALTLELEKELEMHMKKEYFGRFVFETHKNTISDGRKHKITGNISLCCRISLLPLFITHRSTNFKQIRNTDYTSLFPA